MRCEARLALRIILGSLSGLVLLATAYVGSVSAAECTNTWVGPSEGTWQVAANWSAGHLPTSSEVACIGSGNAVNVTSGTRQVGAVQGEGGLALSTSTLQLMGTEASSIGKLTMNSGGFLGGPGNLEVTESLSWTGTGAAFTGTGATVILSGAEGVIAVPNTNALLSGRDLVNQGTLALSAGQIQQYAGSEVVNEGTFTVNSETSPAIAKGTENPKFVNLGTFRKASGSGVTRVDVPFQNQGTVSSQSGRLRFFGGGASSSTNQWETTGSAWIDFSRGSFELQDGVLAGSISLQYNGNPQTIVSLEGMEGENAEITVENHIVGSGQLTIKDDTVIKALTMKSGHLGGAGTLEISDSLSWIGSGGAFVGTGSTVILPGAEGVIAVPEGETALLSGRDLINQGTLSLSAGNIQQYVGSEIVNEGIFTVNSETSHTIYKGSNNPRVVNRGIFQKTSGTGTSTIEPDFINYGVIREVSGQLKILRPFTIARSEEFGKRSKCADPVDCATGNFAESQTDIAIGGRGVGLVLARTYSAQAAAVSTSPGPFGYGWTSSFGDRLAIEGGGEKVTLIQSNGSTIPFTKVGGTNYAAPVWSTETLSGSPEAGYTLTRADQTQLDFSGTGRLEGLVDRNGNETALAYDEAGRLKTVEDPAGRQITFTYNAGGQVESAEDPMGRVVKYVYEAKHLKSVTLPGEEGARWQFKCDGSHRITEMVDGRGGKTTNEYDSSSRVISQTDPAGRTITFEYAPFHTKVTNLATGAVTDQWFTSNNQPYSITRGFGTADATTETFSYNEAGQLTSTTDGNGHTTTFAYDAQGNLKGEKDAEGNESKWTYNGTHDVISMTTPGGEVTTIERDGDGNVESISRPGPEETTQTTTFDHDEHGQLESVTDPLERTWTYAYNEQGDRIAEADPEGNTRSLEYDENSRLEAIVSPRGNAEGAEPSEYTTTIERDPQGRPLKVTDPLGHATEFAYDGNGNLKAKTDAKGRTTEYFYNGANERTKVEKPNGAVLETGYDGAGNVTSQTDGDEKTTTYVRNILGQPVEVIDPLNRKTIEEFDDAGNLKAVIDPAERKTSYAYDKADRLIGIDYSSEATPDASFEYDADGNVIGMVDGTGESTFAYDELGRLTESENGHGDVVGYDYDLAEQLTGILYPNGKGISRAFDQAGRLESVTDWLGGTTTFGYDPESNLESIAFPAASGNVDEFLYDRAGRMSDATFAKGEETLASISYTRDELGQIEAESREGLPGIGELSYSYDENDRLIEAGAASFEYDDADNLTKAPGTTNAYDAASQLETGTGVAYAYNKLGQRIETTPAIGPATTYGYDQAGNLIAVERAAEGEVPAIAQSLAYDGTGLLASKTLGMSTQHFSWDSSAELPLLLDDGENSYIYGPYGLPIEQISLGEEPTYLHHDQLGSTRLLTDSGGEATATFSFTPYGGLEGQSGTATTPLGFAGQYADPETGLQYLRARFYDPATAQFLTKDPLAAATWSPYGYANQNPLRYVDPNGMACVGVGHEWGIPYPTLSPGDCASEATEAAFDNSEVLTAPIVFAICVFTDYCAAATLSGVGANGVKNGVQGLTDPCFDWKSASLQDLLVTLAGAFPGLLYDATAGRYSRVPMIARRVLSAILNAPGLAADLLLGIRGLSR